MFSSSHWAEKTRCPDSVRARIEQNQLGCIEFSSAALDPVIKFLGARCITEDTIIGSAFLFNFWNWDRSTSHEFFRRYRSSCSDVSSRTVRVAQHEMSPNCRNILLIFTPCAMVPPKYVFRSIKIHLLRSIVF